MMKVSSVGAMRGGLGLSLVCAALTMTVGCDGTTPLDGVDSGATPDARVSSDAGAGVDAQVENDGGGPLDAGSPRDSGVVARSGLLAYEPFEGSGLLSGATGGLGWRTPWMGPATLVEADLTYARAGRALDALGAAADVSGGASSRRLDVTGIPAALVDTPGKLGAAGRAVWLSFVARSPRVLRNGEFAGLQLFDGDSEVRFLGAPFFEASDPARAPHWGLDRPGLSTPIYSDVPVTETSLLVVRVDFGIAVAEGPPRARTSMWVSPGLDDEARLGAPDVELEGPDFRFDRVQMTSGVMGFRIDELRIGESFADVVPSAARASLFAYEPFDAEPGPVLGTVGGFGWEAPWTSPSGTASRGVVVAPGLALDIGSMRIANRGNALGLATEGPPARRRLARAGIGAVRAGETGLGAPGSPVWLSFVAEASRDLGNEQFAGVQLFEDDGSGGLTERLFVGAPYYLAESEPGNERALEWGLDRPGLVGPPIYSGASIRARALLVVRVAIDGTGARTSLWVSPALDATEAMLGAPDAELTGPAFRIAAIQVFGNNDILTVDEVRLGTDLASVLVRVP